MKFFLFTMNSVNDSEIVEEKTGFFILIKKLWPHFLIYNTWAFTASMLVINIVLVSNIMWPGDTFIDHAAELGILIGASVYIMAFSGILFGILADRFSRIKLMAIVEGIFGIGLFANGFIPDGQGSTTFTLFLIFSLVRGFSRGGFWPLITSHVNDSTEDKERSQYFGAMQATFQLFQIIGMVISALAFQNLFWREYFFIGGFAALVFSLVIFIRGKEPKRGATRKELKKSLKSEEIVYDYRLTKETIKSTIIAPTNLIALFEGIFTTILLAVPDFLMVAYLQSPPYHLSPVVTGIFMIIFGLPGGVIGSIAFAKMSDKLAKKNIKNRIYMIVISIVSLSSIYVIIFTLPIPHMTPEQGNNLLYLFSYPVVWILGITALIARSIVGLWNINQPPILQEINLPEAQGKVSSANQFLEMLGSGSGPIIAGVILVTFGQSFQIAVLITMILGIIGGLLWLLATLWVNDDVNRISAILKEREKELMQKNNT